MNKRILTLGIIMALTLVIFLTPTNAISNPPGAYTYAIAVPGAPRTDDPAKAYDTASAELIFNVYETVIFFNRTSFGTYLPMIAYNWTVFNEGLSYKFWIRRGIMWQNPAYGNVTAADVEYSWERVMVLDYVGGPGWMFYQPILGQFTANDTGDLLNPPNAYTIALGQAIDAAITSDTVSDSHVVGSVTVNFATGKKYAVFPAILSQSWAAVLSKAWCISKGDWPGTGLQDGTWVSYHGPLTSVLDNPAHVLMGSGPFAFDFWDATAWSLTKFNNYWAGWPAGPKRAYSSLGYVTRVTEYFVADWPSRLAGFVSTSPIYDTVTVARADIGSTWQQPGVKCYYPFGAISLDGLYFSYNVGASSPYIGSGTLGTTGIRPDFFSDVHARKGMAYSFNWTLFIASRFFGEGTQHAIPVPDSFTFFNGAFDSQKYSINIPTAKAEWAQAWTSVNPGGVMATGMSFTIVYNQESTARQAAAQLLATQLNAENPGLFNVLSLGLPWATYLDQMNSPLNGGRSIMPTFIVGWQADFPDVHNWVGPFMASWGDYGFPQSIYLDPYSQTMDDLIDWGWGNLTFAGRKANYDALYQIYVNQAPSVPLVQGLARRWQRDWVHGWYYNAIYPGAYVYPLWKQDMTTTTQPQFAGKVANWEDITEDGKVDIRDLSAAAKAFGAYYIQPVLPPNPTGPPGTFSLNWDSRADVNKLDPLSTDPYAPRGDMKVDVKDLAQMAKLYGFVGDNWPLPP